MIVISFALPHESRCLLRRLGVEGRENALLPSISCRFGGEEIRIIHTGIGSGAAQHCVEDTLSSAKVTPSLWIGSGFAGGLRPAIKAGSLLLEDSDHLAPGTSMHWSKGVIHSVSHPVESVSAKSSLFLQTNADAVDMETATLRKGCLEHSVPFIAMRAISDPAGLMLPVPFGTWFDSEKQRPRIARLMLFLAGHPHRVAPFCRFVRDVQAAQWSLAEGLPHLLTRVITH